MIIGRCRNPPDYKTGIRDYCHLVPGTKGDIHQAIAVDPLCAEHGYDWEIVSVPGGELEWDRILLVDPLDKYDRERSKPSSPHYDPKFRARRQRDSVTKYEKMMKKLYDHGKCS